MRILLQGATLVTMDGPRAVLEGQTVLVQDGVIAEVGEGVKNEGLRIDERIECRGRIILPGLVNAHSHLLEILQRSFRDNVRKETWLRHRQMAEEKARLTGEDIGAAAALACAEMLKGGVTAAVDHFSIRSGITAANMRAILTAFEMTGIRGMLAPSLRDQNFLELVGLEAGAKGSSKRGADRAWQEGMVEVVEQVRRSPGISGIMLGPSSPQNCSDSLLREVARTAERYDLGIHTHLLETALERWGVRRLYRGGVVERLHRLGLLSPRLSAAHCVWLDKKEIDLMASCGASVVHNPASNLKLGSGLAPLAALKRRGVNVALGTDGGDTSDSYSIFEQMRLAAFVSRLTSDDPSDWVTARDALRMGTINGARAIPSWRGRIGKIRAGYRADLVILKPHIRLRPLNDVICGLVYAEGGHSVDTVLVDGKIVVRDGHLTRVNEASLLERVEPISKKMYRIFTLNRKRTDGMELALRELYRKVLGKTRRPGLVAG